MKKVLIIEDDADTLDLLEYIAAELYLEVITSTGLRSVSEVEAIFPDLILLDHRLTVKLGGDLCHRVKSDPATKNIPVILVSAEKNLPQLAAKCLADGYLEKPFNIADIEGIINKYTL